MQGFSLPHAKKETQVSSWPHADTDPNLCCLDAILMNEDDKHDETDSHLHRQVMIHLNYRY